MDPALAVWAAFLHDVGKPRTAEPQDGHFRFPRHEAVGAEMIPAIARRFGLSNAWAEAVGVAVRLHMRPLQEATPKAVRRFQAEAGGHLPLLEALCRADGEGRRENLEAWFAPQPVPLEPVVRGRDLLALGFQPGPEMGRLLRKLYELQLAEGLDREALLDGPRGAQCTNPLARTFPRGQGGLFLPGVAEQPSPEAGQGAETAPLFFSMLLGARLRTKGGNMVENMAHSYRQALFLAFRGVRNPGGLDLKILWEEKPFPQEALADLGGVEYRVRKTLRAKAVRLGKDPDVFLGNFLRYAETHLDTGLLERQMGDYRLRRDCYWTAWKWKEWELEAPHPLRLHHPLNDGAVLVGGALELLLWGHPVPLAFGPLPNPLLVAASYPQRGRKEWREGLDQRYPHKPEADARLEADEYGFLHIRHEDGRVEPLPKVLPLAGFINLVLDHACEETWLAVAGLAIAKARV